jgi:hypothetical protein
VLCHREVHEDVNALDPLLAVALNVRPRQLLRAPPGIGDSFNFRGRFQNR